jgi:hypothetical protein
LNNFLFYFTENIKPNYKDLKILIETAGGKVITKNNNSLKN